MLFRDAPSGPTLHHVRNSIFRENTLAKKLVEDLGCVYISVDNINAERGLHGGEGVSASLMNSQPSCAAEKRFRDGWNRNVSYHDGGTSLFSPTGCINRNADPQLGTRATSSNSEGTGTLSRFAGMYLNCRTADNNSS